MAKITSEMTIPGISAVSGSKPAIRLPSSIELSGAEIMKLTSSTDRICARWTPSASSCTVVRTSVVVTPMLKPHANITA